MDFTDSSAASQARNSSSLAHSNVIPPFPRSYAMLPLLGVVARRLARRASSREALLARSLWVMAGPVGISNSGMCGYGEEGTDYLPHPPLTFRTTPPVHRLYLRVI